MAKKAASKSSPRKGIKAKKGTTKVTTAKGSTNKGKFVSPATIKSDGTSTFHFVRFSPVDGKTVSIVLTKEDCIILAHRLMTLGTSKQIVDHEGGAVIITAHEGNTGSVMGRLAKPRRQRAG